MVLLLLTEVGGRGALPTKWAILPTNWSSLWRLRCAVERGPPEGEVVEIIFNSCAIAVVGKVEMLVYWEQVNDDTRSKPKG